MRVCNKCKGKSESYKEYGIYGTMLVNAEFDEEKEEIDLCQDCYEKVYNIMTGKDLFRGL